MKYEEFIEQANNDIALLLKSAERKHYRSLKTKFKIELSFIGFLVSWLVYYSLGGVFVLLTVAATLPLIYHTCIYSLRLKRIKKIFKEVNMIEAIKNF